MGWKGSILTDFEWAYIAGFIDGEGCIGVYSRSRQHKGSRQITSKRSYRPRLSIVNTNLDVMLWFYDKFGGALRQKARVDKCKVVYHLNIQDFETITIICRNIIPYLIVKKKQAELVLNFPHNIKCNQYTVKLTKDTEEMKEFLYNETLFLNKRGYVEN